IIIMEELNNINSKKDPFEEAERNFKFKLQPSLKKILLANFKFLDGHKKQLTMVIEYYKNLYSNKFELNQTPDSNHIVNKNKPSQKINNSKEHRIKNKFDEKQVLNINLPEEKKTTEQNISEWINRKYNAKNNENDTNSVMYKKQDLIKNILDNQTVSVKLCNQIFNEEDPDNIEFNEEFNNVTSDITCFCGIHTKKIKEKKLFKGSVQQTNTVKNYFTLAKKGNVEPTPTHESTKLKVIPCTSTKQIQDSSKWINIKYSRSERAKRAREQILINCGEKQLLITNYFEIVDKITM
ncbi:hypothetical protein AGLY_018040, partial [Aphis glycines]